MADFVFSEDERRTLEDFLWLRYLEIEANDPTQVSSNVLRESKKFKKLGTTPFTLTKRMRKEEDDDDFGFQIDFTKPISINSITKNSPAEKSHLECGDLIIFIENVNVVDMQQSEILKLIDKDTLIIEVFRRGKVQKVVTIESESSVPNEATESIEKTPIRHSVDVRRNKLTSKNSTDSKKKHLTFSNDESTSSSVDSQRSFKLLLNLVAIEKQFMESLVFGQNRYIEPLMSRKDLISSKEHEILFGNIENIKIVMEKICFGGQRDNPEIFIQSYRRELKNLIREYESYFFALKQADTIIVDKTHHPNFIKFIANPTIPSNQPLFHNFIQKPLEFYNDLQKHFQIILGQYKVDSVEYRDLNDLIYKLQMSYREAMKKAAENKVEVKPLLKTLESRLVFTKCKPFKLDVPGRVFVFAGDLLRIEKEKEFPTYTLLFSDIILFSTINRDRVLFVGEEPINIKSVVETFFNIRKKENEFRLTIETNPNYKDLSPTTTRCTPDIIRRSSPLREHSRKKIIVLRAQSEEIKKVWQNLISQSVFKINNSFSETNFCNLEPQSHRNIALNPSIQTENISSTKRIQTEIVRSPKRKSYSSVYSNQLNLKSQNAIDLGGSLEKILIETSPETPKTPDTPSLANLSLNEKIQKSLSFSSSARNEVESCEGIFDFECDLFACEDVCNETIFIEDPFFDES